MGHSPEHYAKFSDKEIYNALCQISPDLERSLSIQVKMVLSGWTEDAIMEKLKEEGDAQFVEQMNGTPGHLMRRALRHLISELWAQQSTANLN